MQIEFFTYFSRQLDGLLRNGDIDLAIGAFPPDSAFTQAAILYDTIYLTVSDRLLYTHYGSEAKALKRKAINGAHVEDFAELPFILPTAENRQYDQLYQCFQAAQVKPKCFMTTTFPQFFFNLCEQGMAAIFLSETHLHSMSTQMRQGINLFPLYLGNEPMYHIVSVVYSKNRRLTLYAKRFIEITSNLFDSISQERNTPK